VRWDAVSTPICGSSGIFDNTGEGAEQPEWTKH
jgi:hypothetical protein